MENAQIPNDAGIAKTAVILNALCSILFSSALFPEHIAAASKGTSEREIPEISDGGRLYIGSASVEYVPNIEFATFSGYPIV